jgi:hypothetical protein
MLDGGTLAVRGRVGGVFMASQLSAAIVFGNSKIKAGYSRCA